MKTTIELPEEVLQRAKITAIQRKTTLKELIHQSLLRELDQPAQAQRSPSPSKQALAEDELPYYRHPITGFLVSRSLNTPGFVPPTPEESEAMIERASAEVELPYVIDPTTGMAMARTLNTPGFVPPTPEESRAIIERANEEEDLRRAGLLA